MDYDPHTLISPDKSYTVRSIYFDDKYLRYYYQKEFNHGNRKKVRLRGYGYNPESDVVMEIKRKYSGAGTKNRIFVDYPEAIRAIKNCTMVKGTDAENMFLYHIIRYRLYPTVNVVYDREAFMMPYETANNLRVTFDKNLRFSHLPDIDSLFMNGSLLDASGTNFILEIKFNHFFPEWLGHIVANLALKRSPASKYAICVSRSPILRSGVYRYNYYRTVKDF